MEQIPAFYFDREQLGELARRRSVEFREAEPFPHAVMEDFLPSEIIDLLIDEFPPVDAIDWTWWGPGRTRPVADSMRNKLGQSREDCFGPFTRHFMGQLCSDTFLCFLSELTGIERLVVDPSYNLCGLHSTGRNGRLMIHTDVNRHPHSGHSLHQVLNLILFLNRDWKEEYGGQLELWTRDRQPCKKVTPDANTAVLFETGTRSFHGHPVPLACPENRRRNSLAIYYYSLDRLTDDDYHGMQRSVNWVPSTEEDRDVAREAAERAAAMVTQFHGVTLPLPRDLLPFALPGMRDDGADLSLGVIDWPQLEPSTREALERWLEKHLAGSLGASLADFLERYVPFATIAPSKDTPATDPGVWLALLERSTACVHLPVPGSEDLLFCAHVDELVHTLTSE